MGGVPEHDAHKLSGQASGEDAAVEALLHQKGQAAGVVDVGVGDEHIVDVIGSEVQLVLIVLILTLLQAAVDENLLAVDCVGGAEKCQFHGIASFVYSIGACPYCTPLLRKKPYLFVNIV
jgi:hypothetical protein